MMWCVKECAHNQHIPKERESETASVGLSTPCEAHATKTTGVAGDQHDESTRSAVEDGDVHTETNAGDNSVDNGRCRSKSGL